MSTFKRSTPSRFFCLHCPNNYKTANGCYKHELKHKAKRYICEMCSKGFTFPEELMLHIKIHTKKDMYQCTNCPRWYTSNNNMLAHQATHQNKVFQCTVCRKKFNTKPNFDQHTRGCHGIGWLTPCGKSVDWPQKLSWHKYTCSTCKGIILRQKHKATRLAKN